MRYSKYATASLISSALIYMIEKLLVTIPHYLEMLSGSYTNMIPEVSLFDNVFVPILFSVAMLMYLIDFYYFYVTMRRHSPKNDKNQITQSD